MSGDPHRGRIQPGSPLARVRLADLEPEMVRLLTPEDREAIEHVTVPVLEVRRGAVDIAELLERHDACAAIVRAGMLLRYLQIGAQPGVHVLGPGSVLASGDAPRPAPSGISTCRAADGTQLALLGSDFLAAVRRSPRLLTGLHAGIAEQLERIAIQLVICQLPRVEDRLLAMLWLLADSWGRVTTAGTILPLGLTHEVLGALVGARRPTVTLALRALAERGAVVHQDRGWLLLEPPVSPPVREIERLEDPRALDDTQSEWAADVRPAPEPAQTLAALSDSVRGLREQHALNVQQVREHLRRSARTRELAVELRERIRAGGAVSRRPPSA